MAADWVDHCVDHWARRGAALDPRLLEPWLVLLRALGPTPKIGPLTHDWLLPRAGGSFGLNLFSPNRRALAEVLHDTAKQIGGAAPDSLVELEREASSLTWAAGVEGVGGEAKLKIWLLGPPGDLARFDGSVSQGLLAMGVDVCREGLRRWRPYVRWEQALERGPVGEAWGALPLPSALSHRLVVPLRGRKWSYDHVFRADAPLDALTESKRLLRALDVTCAGPDVGFCGAVEAGLGPSLHLRAAAFELDWHADGTAVVDALVTVAGT